VIKYKSNTIVLCLLSWTGSAGITSNKAKTIFRVITCLHRMDLILFKYQISICLRLLRLSECAVATGHKGGIVILNITSFSQVAVFLLRIMGVMGSNIGLDWARLWFYLVLPGEWQESTWVWATAVFFHIFSNSLLKTLPLSDAK
jgi:hypothetical protein